MIAALLTFLSFWGHSATAFAYAALAIWVVHRYGWANRQQIVLIVAMALTAVWGLSGVIAGPVANVTLIAESARNLSWLGFMFFLLRSGDGREQPRTINTIYLVLLMVLLCQPLIDTISFALTDGSPAANLALQSALLLRMIYAIGALVLVHNLYTVSAPEARWGVSLPMAALAALWTFDLNVYTIAYLTKELPIELISTRGFAAAMLAPVFMLATRRNSA